MIKSIERSTVTKSFYGDKVTVYEKALDQLEENYKEAIETLILIRHICFTSRSGHYKRPGTEREDILMLAEEALKENKK